MGTRSIVLTLVVAVAASLRGAPPDPLFSLAARHHAAGLEAINRADYSTARAELGAARTMYATLRDPMAVAQIDLTLAYEAELRADWAQLRAHAESARRTFAAVGYATGQARALRQLSRDSTLGWPARDGLVNSAVDLARASHDQLLIAEVLSQRGDYSFNRGDYAAAMADFQSAIADFDRHGEPGQLARTLVSLGRVYRAHGEPERALPLYRRALAIQQTLGDAQGAIQSVNAIAVTDDLLDRRADALAEYERALSLARQTGSPRLIGFQLGNLGGTYLKRGEFDRAVRLLDDSLRQPNDPIVKSIRRGQLAEAYRKMGRPKDAVALDDDVVAFDRTSGQQDALIEDLTERARARAALGQTAAALDDVHHALEALETVRHHLVAADAMKQGFTRLYQDAYDVAVDLLARRGDAAGALDTSEQARSRALLDLLASRNLHVPAAPASAIEIQATAKRLGSTLLLYFVTPDVTFAWVVTPRRVTLHRLPVSAPRLSGLVAQTRPARRETVAWTSGATDAAWRQLYRALVEPLKADLPRADGSLLTIVPHGPLFGLSFAGLQDGDGRYLLERYTLDYAPSVAVLRFTAATAATTTRRERYLLVADPESPASASVALPPLPGARDELRAISDVVPAGSRAVLVGKAARLDDVRNGMRTASVVHLATHAVISDTNPLDSFLPLDGGRLTVPDIYQLRLKADLVVLSACRTALGPVSGDGVAGLTRAFVYAGAASVIATTWDVADRPTVRVVRQFYRDRLHGLGKAAALRRAQLELLHELREGSLRVDEPDGRVTLRPDPYFWAGFVLVGEP